MSNTEFTSPVGRIVWGSLYEPNTKDFDGNPMVIKKGPDAGKATQRFEFGLAIPKTQPHFANEPGWGQLIWTTAHAAFPNGEASRTDFSWKITDGDSTAISTKSKSKVRPCDKEGFAGHWVLKFSSSYAPKIYDARDINSPVLLEGKDAIVPGYAVQVIGSLAGNGNANNPGIYLNHSVVGLRAYLPEIRTSSVDVTGKFGGSLPSGASLVPAAGFAPPVAPVAPVATPIKAPTAIVPAPAIMGIPMPPKPPAAVPMPPKPPAAVPMPPTAAPSHKGHPVAAYIAQGWTMEQLKADGYTG